MTFHKKQKVLSKNEVFQKILKFCVWRERSLYEVRTKLKQYTLNANDFDEIIHKISQDGFVNDERFARVYAGSKFRLSKWGKNKIRAGLFSKGIPTYLIEQVLEEEINKEEYDQCLNELFKKKLEELSEKKEYEILELKNRVFRYLAGKGYESELIFELLKGFNLP